MYLCRWRANHVIALGILLLNLQVTAAQAIDCAARVEGKEDFDIQNLVSGDLGLGCQIETPGHAPASVGLSQVTLAQPPAIQPFQVSPPRTSEDTADSAPLMVLFAALLATWLVRTKGCNSK